jgi:hypothetical protein
MPYTGNPATVPADEVRLLLGDTEANPYLSDAEVEWLLSKYEEPVRAAYQGAFRLLARFSHQVSKTVGPTRIEYEGRVAQYRALVDDLKAMGGAVGSKVYGVGAPVAGGLDDEMWSDVSWGVVQDR